MIVRSQPNLRDVLFAVRGSILPHVWRRLLLIAGISVIAVLAARGHPGIFARISAIPFTLVGIALSVFLSFRNSACYDRWWEARKLWGSLIVTCRSIARQVGLLDEEEKRVVAMGLCGFSAGLAARLRGTNEREAIKTWCGLDIASHRPNPTNDALNETGRHFLTLAAQNKISWDLYAVLERQLTQLSIVQGGCERIAATPVPFSYSLLLNRTAVIFCLMLPFALAGSLDWWTLVPVLLVGYTFFGLDALGHQLENPFADEPNGLPLLAMTRTVEREMLSLLGCTDLPAPVEPVDGVLR
jgi:putative membrane protein